MLPVQAANILRQCALPCDRHREEQCIKSRVVKAFPNVAPRGKDQPLFIIVGSEGKGLSRLVREKCDLLISIPMSSAVESLNASVAMSIALYAIDRKRNVL